MILRLANPKEYGGNQKLASQALKKLNEILMIEGLKVELDGVTPRLKQITPQFAEIEEKEELKPLPPPDFLNLKLEPGLGEILSGRWDDIQRCIDADAYLGNDSNGSLARRYILVNTTKVPKGSQ